MSYRSFLFVAIGVFLFAGNPLHAQTTDSRFFLNSLKKFGGYYPTDNSNTSNSFLLGRDNAETFQIFRQNSGDESTFCGSSSWNDCYIFLQTDGNANDPDGAVLFGGVGKNDVFEPHLLIDGDGKISVGTTDLHEKFSVAGNVLAEEVIVKPQNQWSDIVFEEDYDLPTLEEVSVYIENEGHLPAVPSAEEVEKNGLRLGEMDATLLQKVEELTLYAIEQNKQIKSQRRTIRELRRKNRQLQSQIESEKRAQDRQTKRVEEIANQVEALRRKVRRLTRENNDQN